MKSLHSSCCFHVIQCCITFPVNTATTEASASSVDAEYLLLNTDWCSGSHAKMNCILYHIECWHFGIFTIFLLKCNRSDFRAVWKAGYPQYWSTFLCDVSYSQTALSSFWVLIKKSFSVGILLDITTHLYAVFSSEFFKEEITKCSLHSAFDTFRLPILLMLLVFYW